ncbi:MAG TPA: hypothetical protein VK611_06450 [Acidimicrobiales bacterium]|nr:hypothetical protein [Acidimicrobiales bacterium]
MDIGEAAWLGFGGVVAGAVLGFASSSAQEAARRRHDLRRLREEQVREDEIRFENRRFDAYVAMITAATRFYGVAKYPVAAEASVEPGTTMRPIDVAYEQFTATLSPSFLMATSPTTRDCLAALASAVRALRDGIGGDVTDRDVLFKAHRRAVRAAETAMREEFGLVPTLP